VFVVFVVFVHEKKGKDCKGIKSNETKKIFGNRSSVMAECRGNVLLGLKIVFEGMKER
jgi:preprotein translocase subunit SecG